MLQDNLIKAVFKCGEVLPEAEQMIDAGGKMLVPGFIDIHFHGRSGFDFCDGSREALETIAKGIS